MLKIPKNAVPFDAPGYNKNWKIKRNDITIELEKELIDFKKKAMNATSLKRPVNSSRMQW